MRTRGPISPCHARILLLAFISVAIHNRSPKCMWKRQLKEEKKKKEKKEKQMFLGFSTGPNAFG